MKANESNKEIDKIVFNYPLEVAAEHRDGRCIKTNRIWVQGLPMDIAQTIELIDLLKGYGFDIDDSSKEELCTKIAAIALSPKSEKGPKTIDVIRSTSAVAAFVFKLEREHQFAAVPHVERHMTVIEIVTEAKIMVRQQNKNKKDKEVISELRDRQITMLITPSMVNQ